MCVIILSCLAAIRESKRSSSVKRRRWRWCHIHIYRGSGSCFLFPLSLFSNGDDSKWRPICSIVLACVWRRRAPSTKEEGGEVESPLFGSIHSVHPPPTAVLCCAVLCCAVVVPEFRERERESSTNRARGNYILYDVGMTGCAPQIYVLRSNEQ